MITSNNFSLFNGTSVTLAPAGEFKNLANSGINSYFAVKLN